MTTRLTVEADGGSRGNPGPSGYGALVRDTRTAQVLARRNGFLGTTTNNVAEYQGLIAGLRAAATIDPGAEVDVLMDSRLVVEQMSGAWKVKHDGLKPLAAQAIELAAGFRAVRYRWIPRAQNGHADALANEAMDARAGTFDGLDDVTFDPSDPPDAVEPRRASAVGVTHLVLLRHGQTELSVERRFSGIDDPPLTDLGRRQALAAAERLATTGSFDVIVSSPLARARATAEAAADRLGLPVQVEPAWRECDFGLFEGLSAAEAEARFPAEFAAWIADPRTAPPDGESLAAVALRTDEACEQLRTGRYAGARVLVVSHVTPIKSVVGRVLDAPATVFRTLHLDLASLTLVELRDGGGVLHTWNDTAHLSGISEPGPSR